MIRGSASDSGSPQRVSPLLTVKEAAEYLSISERTLWELDARGEVQRTVIGKHSVRYHIDDLNAYITKQRRGGHSTSLSIDDGARVNLGGGA